MNDGVVGTTIKITMYIFKIAYLRYTFTYTYIRDSTLCSYYIGTSL